MLVCWWAYTTDPHPTSAATLPPYHSQTTDSFLKNY